MKYGGLTALGIAVFSVMMVLVMSKNEPEPRNPQKAPNDYFLRQRAYPFEDINYAALTQARQTLQLAKKQQSKTMPSWNSLGPTDVVAGRLTDVEVLPNGTLLLGTATGGIFRSSDDGANWTPVFDDAFSLSIGDMAYAPSNPNRLYVGTGEANGGGGSSTYAGVGVYRSDDGGLSWQRSGLEESRFIGRIIVHPTNADVAYVAAMGELYGTSETRGLYRTVDGGKNWERILYTSEQTGCIDVVLDPQNPEELYAAMWQRSRKAFNIDYAGPESGIFKSTDGGETWKKLSNGLPGGDAVGRIGIALSESNPNILFSIFAAEDGSLAGVFKTTDGGESWARTADQDMADNYRTFGWWFGQIRIHPQNPDFIFAMGLDLYFSQDGGATWNDYLTYAISTGLITVEQINNGTADVMHVDQHAMAFHPNDPNYIVAGNDGGVYISRTDPLNFKNQNNFSNIQFYTCEIDPSAPTRIYGGTQDNGTWGNFDGQSDSWIKLFGGDGFQVEVDPTNSNSIYLEFQFGNLFHFLDGTYIDGRGHFTDDDRGNWNAPILIDPNDSNTVYHASQRLFRTNSGVQNFQPISGDLTNGDPGGNRVFGTITTIGVAQGDSNRIYVGTDDGNFQVTENGGTDWENRNQGLPNRWITAIAVHPTDKDTVYVSLSGFRDLDYQPHLLRSRDAGKTWQDVSNNLPEVPVNDVIVDPSNPNRLFLASDFGVFFSRNEGLSWELLGRDMPQVLVLDIDLHIESKTLVAASFGRGMYRLDLSTILQDSEPVGTQHAHQYLLAELHGGLQGSTLVGIVNTNEDAVNIDMFGFQSNGQLATSEPLKYRLAGKQRVFLDLDQAFPDEAPNIDWLQIGSSLPVVTFAEIGSDMARSAYLGEKVTVGSSYLPHVAADTTQFATYVSAVNPHGVTLQTTIRNGQQNQTQPIREHHTAYTRMNRDIRDYFGQNLNDVPFAVLEEGLRGQMAVEYFHRLPERSQMASLGLNRLRGKTLRFLHVASDTANFWTGMVYINVGQQATQPLETYYAADGTVLEARQKQPLGPGEKTTLLFDQANNGNLPNRTAWIEVTGDQNLIGYDLFGANQASGNDFFAGIQGAYSASQTLIFPHFLSGSDRWLGIVVVNTSDQPSNVSLRAFGENGALLEEQVLENVPGKSKQVMLVSDLFKEAITFQKGAWIEAVGTQPVWNGFLLWGDQGGTTRQNMSGMVAPAKP